jgi:hypothetical protein
VKLVQMPVGLLHVDEADLDRAGVEPGLLAAYRAYLPRALEDRRGLLILAPPSQGGHHLLMLLARRIGAALRDANIRSRDAGGDMRASKLRICYLPGALLPTALATPDDRLVLATEAACFVQDLEDADLDTLLSLVAERQAGGLPTFLQVDAARLLPVHERELRARLPVLESPRCDVAAEEPAPGCTSEGVSDERADLGSTI